MRRTGASLVLLVVMSAVFAPLAHATLTPNAHACCVKQHHRGATTVRPGSSSDQSRHACCTLATLSATPAQGPKLSGRPLPAHPFVEEFYPAVESSDPIARESERAPPTER